MSGLEEMNVPDSLEGQAQGGQWKLEGTWGTCSQRGSTTAICSIPQPRAAIRAEETWQAASGSMGLRRSMTQVDRKPSVNQKETGTLPSCLRPQRGGRAAAPSGLPTWAHWRHQHTILDKVAETRKTGKLRLKKAGVFTSGSQWPRRV